LTPAVRPEFDPVSLEQMAATTSTDFRVSINMHSRTIFLSLRPPFLLLTVVCILLAFSLVALSGKTFDPVLMLAVFLAGLFAHIGVNVLNEYLDFSSGLDLQTIKTPFSGGSGALPQNPAAAGAVLKTAIASITLSAVLGFYLLLEQGSQLLIPGLVGLLIIIAYTRWINRMPWLCLIAPGTGFGLIMVGGSYYALVGESSVTVLLVSLLPFLLVNNLLLLNQYPDIQADQSVGRNHFPIRYGVAASNRVFLAFLVCSAVLLAGLILDQRLPALAWLSLLALAPAVFAYSGARKYGNTIGQQPQYLAANVASVLLTPLLLALSIFFGK